MRLTGLRVQNYRSVVDSGDISFQPLQAFVGENNAGKSNLLYALQVFLTPGAAGVAESDFFRPDEAIIITATFEQLASVERKRLRPYLLGDRLILEKHMTMQKDRKTGKSRPQAEYHGYEAKPRDWWLSIVGVTDREGSRPKWKDIAEEHGILEYVRNDAGIVHKSSYETGLKRLLLEREDIQFEEPNLGQTQALGLQPVLVSSLPNIHILPAITDYSDEIERRASGSNFRRLMGDLADRILKFDPRFQEIESAIKTLGSLLNAPQEGEQREQGLERLAVLETVEQRLQAIIARLMPSVSGVQVKVAVEGVRDVFSRGVSIWVDDGKLTEVLVKGHGLQRCVVFGLLQALILNQRGQLIPTPQDTPDAPETGEQTIILAIEEPELYIHPQMQRLIYSVLKDFAATDQVVYTTHSPSFVDVARYESVAVVRKDSVESGTQVSQCAVGVLDESTERKTFQFLSSFGLEQNQMFFARKVVLVEGDEDRIALLAAGRDLSIFKEFPEEHGFTIVVIGGKQEMKKYIKLLTAFTIPCVILHELDGNPTSAVNQEIINLAGNIPRVVMQTTLEDIVGHTGHFSNAYSAKKFFENPQNLTDDLKRIVKQLFA